MNKSIWIINQHTSTPKTSNGHYRHFYLSKEYVKMGYRVNMFIGSHSHVSSRKEKFSGNYHTEIIEGINVHTVKTPFYETSKSIWRIYNLIIFMLKLLLKDVSKLEKPDVILVSSMPLFSIINGLWWKRKFKGAKMILELRDIWPKTAIELGSYSTYHPFIISLRKIEKWGYRRADYITSVLPNANQHISKTIGKEPRFKHISNGVDREVVDNQSTIPYSLSSMIPGDKYIVGYAGTLGNANAMEYLIKAANAMKSKDICFVIVGAGNKKDELVSLSSQNHQIIFHDKIEKLQVQDFLKRCDLLFLGWRKTSLYQYGVSANKIFDYMLSGKPILMSGDIPKSEIAQAKCGLLVKPESPEAIKNAVLKFSMMHKEETEKMGLRGRQFILKHRMYYQLAEKYMSIFKELEIS